jgi:WD40 repeat protein
VIRLEGHTSWVSTLAFSPDGGRLVSAATDQTIRFWNTSTWIESRVLRGHTDEVQAVAVSEPASLVASTGKDGNLILWKQDDASASEGYVRLAKDLRWNQVLLLDRSGAALFPDDQPPELFDLRQGAAVRPLPELGLSSNVLKCFHPNWLCRWDGTDQILFDEWNGSEFIRRGAVNSVSRTRPNGGRMDAGVEFSPARQLVAWNETALSNAVFVAALGESGRPVELKSEVTGLFPYRLSADGKYLAALAETAGWLLRSLRVWIVDTGQNVLKSEQVSDVAFAVGGRVLVASVAASGENHEEIRFHDLDHPGQAPRTVPLKHEPQLTAVSPDGQLVAVSDAFGTIWLCDAVKGELIGNRAPGP